jgi:hypothetical protein
MSYHTIADKKFWDTMTPPRLNFIREACHEGGFEAAVLPLGDPVASDPSMVLLLKFAPGGTLPRHAHQCHRIELLISGTLTTPDGRVLTAGAVMTSGPGEFYGPHIAGPEGAVTAEIFSSTYAQVDYELSDSSEQSPQRTALEKFARRMEVERLRSRTEA